MAYTLINARPAGKPATNASPTALAAGQGALVDSHNRRVTYLRLSVTDRCDLRCTYCMPERMTFLPRKDVLSTSSTSTCPILSRVRPAGTGAT